MNNHEHSHFTLNKALHDKMSKIYIYQAMLTLAKSMIGIFIPIYLYKLGYSIIDILLYTIGQSLIYLILIPISTKIIQKIGFKYTILLSTPIYLIHLTTLNFLSSSPIFFHLAWISFGVYTAIFWPAMHSEIALNGSNKHRGSQMGTLQIIITIVATLAPFIGGTFLEISSYWNLLILITTIIILGTIPMLLSKDVKIQKFEFEFKDYIKLIKNKKVNNSKIAFASEGIEWLLNITIWPILVFILLNQSFLKLGILLTIVSIISIIIILYIKKILDKKDKNKILKIITKIMSLNWMLKSSILFFGSFFLYFIETIGKLIQTLFNISYSSIFYNNAKKIGYMDYIILRELYLHGTKTIFVLFIIIPYLLIFKENLMILSSIVIIGIIFALGLGFMKEE